MRARREGGRKEIRREGRREERGRISMRARGRREGGSYS